MIDARDAPPTAEPDGGRARLRLAATPPSPAPAPDAAPGAWRAFQADLARYFRYGNAETRWQRLRIVLHTEAIPALAVYRFGRWLREEAPARLRPFLQIPHSIAYEAVRHAFGICLAPHARIGPGLYIGHSGGIWVGGDAVIGAECNLSQGVTIGVGGTARRGTPVVGDRVWIGPKATVVGPIEVGDGAVIGANSLVVSNVPQNGVAVGVPARVVALSGSGALID
jgi:serine O-acetyltransferase